MAAAPQTVSPLSRLGQCLYVCAVQNNNIPTLPTEVAGYLSGYVPV